MKSTDFAPQNNKVFDRMLEYWKDPETWYKEDAPFSWYFDCEGEDEDEIEEAALYLEQIGFETGVIGTDVYVYCTGEADTEAVGINFNENYDRLFNLTFKYIIKHSKYYSLLYDKDDFYRAVSRIPAQVDNNTVMQFLWDCADNAMWHDVEADIDYKVPLSWINTLHGELLSGCVRVDGGLYGRAFFTAVEDFIDEVCEGKVGVSAYTRLIMRIEGFVIFIEAEGESVKVKARDVEAVKVWDKIEKALGLDKQGERY